MMEVNTVTNEKGGGLWITVDSGASENVIPDWMASQFKVKPSTGSRNGVQYVAANGNMMPNRGEKDVKVTTEERIPLRLEDAGHRRPQAADECGSDLRCWTQGTNMFFTDPNTDGLRSQLWLAGTCCSRGEQRKVKFSSCGRQEVDIVLVNRGFLPMPE